MNWDDLRYFLAAWRRGTLAAAARDLRCEHTTVSRRLRGLEASLKSKLFTRTPEGLAPTAAGRELAPLAEAAERAIEAVEQRAGHDGRIAGVVRVTAPEAFSAWVIDQLGALRARHPGLVLEVLPETRTLDLVRGEADVAVRFVETVQGEVVVKKLCEIGGAMYASAAYVARRGAPSPIDDLRGHELVDYAEVLAGVPGAQWLADHRAGASVVFRGSSLLSVLDALAAGLGLGVVPCALARRHPQLQRLSPGTLCSGTLWLAAHPELVKSARVRAVMNCLEEAVRRDRAQLAG